VVLKTKLRNCKCEDELQEMEVETDVRMEMKIGGVKNQASEL